MEAVVAEAQGTGLVVVIRIGLVDEGCAVGPVACHILLSECVEREVEEEDEEGNGLDVREKNVAHYICERSIYVILQLNSVSRRKAREIHYFSKARVRRWEEVQKDGELSGRCH